MKRVISGPTASNHLAELPPHRMVTSPYEPDMKTLSFCLLSCVSTTFRIATLGTLALIIDLGGVLMSMIHSVG